jgi:YbbR domain-containing protein
MKEECNSFTFQLLPFTFFNMAIVKLSTGERRRLSVFFTCLVLAALAWVITTLSNPYSYTVKRVLNFRNIPQKRAFRPLQSDTVDATVRGTGWQMLFSGINAQNKPVTIDLHTLESENYVVLSSQLRLINDRDTSSNIIAFSPDTLYFDFSNRSIKRVPVKLVAALKYMPQFAQSNNAVVKPAYVTITGPSERIDKITEWDTDSLLADNVNATIRQRVNLNASEGNITISPKTVDVVVPKKRCKYRLN